jgi:hypothetical protein
MSATFKIVFGLGAPQVKILVPWSGEPQIFESLSKLKCHCDSIGICLEVIIFSGYGNIAVHRLIYNMVNISEVPCVKFDGDMGFIDLNYFFEVISCMPNDIVKIFKVRCNIVKKNIHGIHFFGSGVSALTTSNDLFPDQYSGQCKVVVSDSGKVFISHCVNPTKEQVCNFVGHRLRKIVRSNFKRFDYLPLFLRAAFWHPYKVLTGLSSILVMVFSSDYKKANRIGMDKKQKDLHSFLTSRDLLKE